MLPRCCGNRHCPACQQHKGYAWLARQLDHQLPSAYFLLTFTVPESLRAFLRSNQRTGYAALFEASSGAIKTLCANPRFGGADTPGFFGVLPTWGRALQFHPHIHSLVPGGAFSSADWAWHPSDHGFCLPVQALSRGYRAKFREAMAREGLLDQIPPGVWAVDWNVNAQAVGDAANSLAYLARYVFKVAISESRIQSVDDTHVCFTYRKVHSQRVRTMRLPIFAFLHRVLQHVLPSGFMKVRYFGYLSPSFKMPFEEIRARIELAQATGRHRGHAPEPASLPALRSEASLPAHDLAKPLARGAYPGACVTHAFHYDDAHAELRTLSRGPLSRLRTESRTWLPHAGLAIVFAHTIIR